METTKVTTKKNYTKSKKTKEWVDPNLADLEMLWKQIGDCCEALYASGSRVDPVIKDPHDYDYILFVTPKYKHMVMAKLQSLGLLTSHKAKYRSSINLDFFKLAEPGNIRISEWSYLDNLNRKLFGNDALIPVDVLDTHREAFILSLKKKALELQTRQTCNQKRWYHILRGVYILLNNSYKVSKEQKKEINILHDLSEGWQTVKTKTIELLKTLV